MEVDKIHDELTTPETVVAVMDHDTPPSPAKNMMQLYTVRIKQGTEVPCSVCQTVTRARNKEHAQLLAWATNGNPFHVSNYEYPVPKMCLGEGTYAIVEAILYRDEQGPIKMATKRPRFRQLDETDIMHTLKTEFQWHYHLNHMFRHKEHERKHVVAMLDSFVDERLIPHMVFERAEGSLDWMMRYFTPFQEMIRRPEVRLEWLRQLLTGLVVLHDKCNAIHRDIKPLNVLVYFVPQIHLAIGDLGSMCEDGAEATKVGGYEVTRSYRPPEVAFRLNTYTKALDMFSLACLYLELVGMGEFFFFSDSTKEHRRELMKILAPHTSKETKEYYLRHIIGDHNKQHFESFFPPVDQQQQPPTSTNVCVERIKQHSKVPLTDLEIRLLYNWLRLDPRRRPSAAFSLEFLLRHQNTASVSAASSCSASAVPAETPVPSGSVDGVSLATA